MDGGIFSTNVDVGADLIPPPLFSPDCIVELKNLAEGDNMRSKGSVTKYKQASSQERDAG